MRIGIDLRVLDDPFGSGVARYTTLMLAELKKILTARGHTLIGYRSGHRRKAEKILENEHVVQLPNTILNLCSVMFGLPTSAQCFPKADLIWQPNPLFLGQVRIPLFVTIHDLSFVRQPETFPLHTRLWYLRNVKNFLRRADPGTYLMAVSEHTKDDILDLFPQWKGRVFVVPPPLLSSFLNEGAPVKTNKQKYFLYVGAVEVRKNVVSLMNGFIKFRQSHPDYQLYVVGRQGFLSVNNMIDKDYLLKNGVVLAGYVDETERRRLLVNASGLIYPSFYEGFGYPPLEALEVHVPVIAGADTALTKTLGDAALWINPYRIGDELPGALAALVDSPEYRQHMIEKGLKQLAGIQKDFSLLPLVELWERFASV
ncbi:MAG: glycosyltransferase family 1 protein [Patescibacteria group bacterium]|jgi:glycosyltransferase involved in cell wall biosynthesis